MTTRVLQALAPLGLPSGAGATLSGSRSHRGGSRGPRREAAPYSCRAFTPVWLSACEWPCSPGEPPGPGQAAPGRPAAPPRWGHHTALWSPRSTVVGSGRCRQRVPRHTRHHVRTGGSCSLNVRQTASGVLVSGPRVMLQTCCGFPEIQADLATRATWLHLPASRG